jgi:hypothetical protein
MIDVQGTDGQQFQFPDGMSELAIADVLRRYYAGEKRPEPTSLSASNAGVVQTITAGMGDHLFAGAMTPIELGIGALTGEDSGKGVGGRIRDAFGRALERNQDATAAAQSEHPTAMALGEIAGVAPLAGRYRPSMATASAPQMMTQAQIANTVQAGLPAAATTAGSASLGPLAQTAVSTAASLAFPRTTQFLDLAQRAFQALQAGGLPTQQAQGIVRSAMQQGVPALLRLIRPAP